MWRIEQSQRETWFLDDLDMHTFDRFVRLDSKYKSPEFERGDYSAFFAWLNREPSMPSAKYELVLPPRDEESRSGLQTRHTLTGLRLVDRQDPKKQAFSVISDGKTLR
jgi:hypothetical protein